MINILGNFARLEELFLMLDAKLSEIDLAITSFIYHESTTS
ncbi:hypothetical protein [Pseudoalteromonas sp. SA25]|nr:hypothetical protein [Pseudoalteromonas sp. SA25]